MDKKGIAVFVLNKRAIRFLDSFFSAYGGLYQPSYFTSAEGFVASVAGEVPAAAVVEDKFLPRISNAVTKLPVVAMITGDIGEGLDNVINHTNHGTSRHLQRPFVEKGLQHLLESVILEREAMERAQVELQEMQTINEVVRLISSTLNPRELLYRVVKKVSEIMPVTRCSMVRVDWLHKYAHVVASYEDPELACLKLNLKKYPEITAALMSGEPVLVRDVGNDPLMKDVKKYLDPLGIKAILVIPVVFREKIIGTLFLRTSRSTHSFSTSEMNLLNIIGSASANALYNAFLFEQIEDEKTRLEKLAITDYLTGVYNVRYFYHRIIEEFCRAERYSLPISCLMIDIDFFKKINDQFGHKMGDQVLKEFAQFVKKRSRKSDVLARYGGEEFIIMMPQTDPEGALSEAERLRLAIKKYRFKGLGTRRGLTVSIGVASYPHRKIRNHDQLIASSDDALYRAKAGGRDQIIVF